MKNLFGTLKLIIWTGIAPLFIVPNIAMAYNGPNEIEYKSGYVQELDYNTACEINFSDIARINDLYIYTDEYNIKFYNYATGWSHFYELDDPTIKIRDDYGNLIAYSGSCYDLY